MTLLFYLLDLVYFYLCIPIKGPTLIPVLIKLTGLSSVNILTTCDRLYSRKQMSNFNSPRMRHLQQ